MNEAVERLLRDLEERPKDAPRLLSRATAGAAGEPVRAALSHDPRFAPGLLSVCQDPLLLAEVKWVVQFLGRQGYEAAVPALLRAWREGVVGLSDQAGRAVIEMQHRAGMEAMVADLGHLRGLLANVALEAAVALGDTFERVSSVLGDDGLARDVLSFLGRRRSVFDSDDRWMSFAVEALHGRSPDVGRTAHTTLSRILSKREVAGLMAGRSAEKGAARGKEPTPAALRRARSAMVALRDALGSGSWTAPGPEQSARLDTIEAIVGPLPAMARALYETMDGIRVDAPRPADRFMLYPLTEAIQEAKAFERRYPPTRTARDLIPAFLFPVAPDGYEKAGLSGGPPVGFEIPCDRDDPRLSNVSRRPKLSTFVRRARGRTTRKKTQR